MKCWMLEFENFSKTVLPIPPTPLLIFREYILHSSSLIFLYQKSRQIFALFQVKILLLNLSKKIIHAHLPDSNPKAPKNYSLSPANIHIDDKNPAILILRVFFWITLIYQEPKPAVNARKSVFYHPKLLKEEFV